MARSHSGCGNNAIITITTTTTTITITTTTTAKTTTTIIIIVIIIIIIISNSNWTEWSTIQGLNARVISKSDEREARDRFEITSTITP